MTPSELSAAIADVLRAAVAAGDLALDPAALPDEPKVERPKNPEHGDWSTNVAMVLAKPTGRPPREVAALVADALGQVPGIASVEIAGPGFLNIRLSAASAGEAARTIVLAGAAYGTVHSSAGESINLEFISANPTGPLHLGHTRWAAVGDAIGRVLEAAGAAVTREFYVNDRGVQMDRFGASVEAAALGLPTDRKSVV